MSDFVPNVAAYFARIGVAPPPDISLASLNRIVAAHVQAIPFENLDILLGRGVSVELADIEKKLVHEQRGGYCFEQNTLLQCVLQELGFDVQPISARVRIKTPRSIKTARTHLFLRVELEEGSHLVDVGVGALSCTSALRLELDTPQPTPHETRRIVATGDWSGFEARSPDALLYHQVLLNGTWEDICEFTLEEMFPIDRELGNWFTSAHPASHFKNRLLVARATRTGRKTLLNRTLKVRDADGEAKTQTLTSDSELLEALRTHFGLEFPAGTTFDCEGLAAHDRATEGDPPR